MNKYKNQIKNHIKSYYKQYEHLDCKKLITAVIYSINSLNIMDYFISLIPFYIINNKNIKILDISTSILLVASSSLIVKPSLLPFRPSNTSPIAANSVVQSYPPSGLEVISKFFL